MTTDHPQSAPAPSLLAALFGDGSPETAVPAAVPPLGDALGASAPVALPASSLTDAATSPLEYGNPASIEERSEGTNEGQLDAPVLSDLLDATLEEESEPWMAPSARAGKGEPLQGIPAAISDTPATSLDLGPLSLLDLTEDLAADPLASADAVLADHGIGDGHDLRDVLAILPPELLTRRLLYRCLPGLAHHWPELRYLVTDAVHAAGRTLAADPIDNVLPLLDARDEVPPSIAVVDTDPFPLFWHEVSTHRLLTRQVQHLLGEWIADGRHVARVTRSFREGHDRAPTAPELVTVLVPDLCDTWRFVRAHLPDTLRSVASWRAALLALAHIGVADDRVAEVAASVGTAEDETRAALRRSEAVVRLLPDEALTGLCEALYTGGVPSFEHNLHLSALEPDFADVTIARGRAAEQVMLRHNLRLVVAMARRYVHRLKVLDLSDLVQEGSTGLQRAIEKWEPARGYAFSTYATAWIKQAITRAIADHDLVIRLPVHMIERCRMALEEESLGLPLMGEERFLLNEEEAALLALRASDTARLERLELLTAAGIPVEMATRLAGVLAVGSLADTPVSDEEWLGANMTDRLDETVDQRTLRAVLLDVLGSLTDRERRVLTLRFGLDGGEARTLEAVGHAFGVTRERIRQIEAKAIKRLQHPNRSRRLRDFVDMMPRRRVKAAAAPRKSADRTGQSGVRQPDSAPVLTVQILEDRITWASRRERTVLYYRLGLVDGRAWSREEVAKKMKLSTVRVRWIEDDALTLLPELLVEHDGGIVPRLAPVLDTNGAWNCSEEASYTERTAGQTRTRGRRTKR